ncbi:MAG: AbrB/MazE/SpoVT family DNA-binding domain-containing protein [bacterium]|nr:AbrB/MazE/SpoVT family DNA-binding domain-containing protein [bacterium]
MSNTGIIRRVDELGRLVIPKEVRNSLRIKSGDCLEVFLDNDTILIRKKDLISKTYKSIENIINIIAKICSVDIILTDLDKVLFKNGKIFTINDETKISKYIYNEISERKDIIKNNTIEFDNNLCFLLKPLIINGDAIGSIILLKKEKINDTDIINAEIINNLLINYLEV